MAVLRASTVVTVVLLGAVAMFGPAPIIFHIPLVPNWPYIGLSSLAASAILGLIYAAFMWRRLKRPVPITTAWVVRVFPVWVSVFALFWSYVRLTTEEYPSMQFSDATVVEKYRSRNHNYLSVRVQVPGRGILAVEGISPESWEKVSAGSRVSKRCGASDIRVETP